MSGKGLVLLAGEGESTRILAHFLAARFPLDAVLLERPVPRSVFLKRRIKSLGWRKVAGQLAFQAAMSPILQRAARARRAEIKRQYAMDDGPLPEAGVIRIDSANSDSARARLVSLAPAVVVINGTRILSGRTLASVDAAFVNLHAGITPLFRGVHGGYWAMAQGLPEQCGVTAHRVDTGIDTGCILEQARIHPGPRDNFTTYPLLQLGEGMRLLEGILPDLLEGRGRPARAEPPGPSRLWSHPTAWGYLATRIGKGVK